MHSSRHSLHLPTSAHAVRAQTLLKQGKGSLSQMHGCLCVGGLLCASGASHAHQRALVKLQACSQDMHELAR